MTATEWGRLTFVWWNVRLPRSSPTDAATAEAQRALLLEVLEKLAATESAIVIALSEIDPEHSSVIRLALKDRFDSRPLSLRASDAEFDAVLLWDRSAVRVGEQRRSKTTRGRRSRPVCTELNVEWKPVGAALVLSLVHWPSKLYASEDDFREQCGSELRARLRVDETPTVVLGDLNAEPFEPCVRSHLCATRDRAASVEYGLAYNLAWRWLGHRDAHPTIARRTRVAGTYFHGAAAANQQWYTFDQAIVTPNLLVEYGVRLDEARSGVLAPDELFNDQGRLTAGFDHLPIQCSLAFVVP